MFVELTRSNGDPVMINLNQVMYFYPMANGQSYLIFNGERFNLTVDERYDYIVSQLKRTGMIGEPERMTNIKASTA